MRFPKLKDSVLDLFEGVVHPDDRGQFRLHDYMMDGNYYEWYYSIAGHLKPKTIAEIGVRFGYSARAMLAGVGKGGADFVGWDNECGWPGSNAYAETHLGKLAGRVYLFKQNTQDESPLQYPRRDLGPVDLFHIDGEHSPGGVRTDLRHADGLLAPTGHILVDDSIVPGVREAVTVWAGLHSYVCFEIVTYRGMLVLRKDNATND